MRVVVAMSGGVDSSVAAALLVESGHEVVGVHMRLHAGGGGAGRCCGDRDALDARAVSERLDIPFYVIDLEQTFHDTVITELVDTYAGGGTPNPCVTCNAVIKFDVLVRHARALGADRLATGHYARLDADGALRVAADPRKDQSYFLHPLGAEARAMAMFPLGELSKDEVRAHAKRLGVAVADKPESQEICFVPDGDHAALVADHRPDLDGAGEIVDEAGRVVGHHDAYWRFTPGQRRGLGVAMGSPAYVLRVEPDSKRVVVAGLDRLWADALVVRALRWHAEPVAGAPIEVRIRHRGARVPCRVERGEPAAVILEQPVWAPARGQSAVFYQGDRVVAGGYLT